ncbi:glycosyltransferase family 2 protein [Nocardioides mangrovi]|uniref:Glycosyltransferase family 2 protein n=1 Tax=Nocardioides mangrovi TaxID=2874580 RepID=A0ABS7U8W2_9ACTN|nr:glycosyltransferase family 2 protein [Nocardioides mangrovi]MBZ5737302.1 glycosyltransferase family 2 protein [Nocardioides mangrovi]
MLFTASTVKDSLENVEFFVAANLASGVDHMVVFLDAPEARGQGEVAAALDAHPHVTCVPTRRADWWAGDRPQSLNMRQRINANWTRSVLEPFDWAEWLFHVDGDEVACLDRDALDAVPAGVDSVWLPPWEAVSEWDRSGRPTRFKRLLEDGDLNLLHVLGAVDEPSNQSYFHGHVMGKSGVRPGSGLGLTLHVPVTADGERPERHEDPRLCVLHYDAPSGEEFVRKWTALAKAGPTRYRTSRQPSARALKRLVSSDLPPETRDKYLRRIYDLTTRDDVELLGDLRLLADRDPLAAGGTPADFPAGAREALAERVTALSAGPKAGYFVEDPRPGNDRQSRWRKRLSPRD